MKHSRTWWQDRSNVFLAECARLIERHIGREAVEAVFLCGSLAAREETIVLESETPILLSDIDLVAVVTPNEVARAWFPRRSELASACEAVAAVEERFLSDGPDGVASLDGTSAIVGLGGQPYRDGSFECYARAGTVRDDAFGLGSLLLASLECEAAAG